MSKGHAAQQQGQIALKLHLENSFSECNFYAITPIAFSDGLWTYYTTNRLQTFTNYLSQII